MFDLGPRTILLSIAGSWSYGTNRSTSDVDVQGVCIPPRAYRDGFLHRFEQADSPVHLEPFVDCLPEDVFHAAMLRESGKRLDGVVYGIAKFFALAADCNPNVVETLWVEPEDIVIRTPLGSRLIDARADFLSQKALYTYRGYAVSQLKRIETHRRWLLAPLAAPPTRAEFGLPEYTTVPKEQLAAAQAAIQKRLDTTWESELAGIDDARLQGGRDGQDRRLDCGHRRCDGGRCRCRSRHCEGSR